jgi:hypothetical protein
MNENHRLRFGLGLAACVWACVDCGANHGRDACAAALDNVAALDEAEGNKVIDSGACDKYEKVEACPAYQKHRAIFDAMAAAVEPCR